MFDKFAIENTNNAFKNKTHHRQYDASVGLLNKLGPGNSIPE